MDSLNYHKLLYTIISFYLSIWPSNHPFTVLQISLIHIYIFFLNVLGNALTSAVTAASHTEGM